MLAESSMGTLNDFSSSVVFKSPSAVPYSGHSLFFLTFSETIPGLSLYTTPVISPATCTSPPPSHFAALL